MTAETTFDEFMAVMQTDRRTASYDQHSMTLIFERLREKVLKREEEDRHHAERHQRRAIDALRHKIKHLEPPVDVRDTWDQVRARLEKYEEFQALETDELRRRAYDKHINRLREKEAERERERPRHDKRDRDHDYRNGDSRRRHDTRTPEPDVYEAERRKRDAARASSYRRSGAGIGLSPPPRARDRDERDRYDDRERRHSSMNFYDRERREKEIDRERSYVSRADPRDVGRELDYGDSTPTSATKRRRDSNEAGSPDSRRDKVCILLTPFSPSSY